MNIVIVTGSHRLNSQSVRVAKLLKEIIFKNEASCIIHELAAMQLPMWNEGVWKGEDSWKTILDPLHEDIANADAFVFVTPEWSGMVPPMLKNYFLLSNHNIMGNKPALIISVSSGMGGSYPVNELRASSYKNTKLCYIPEHIILRKVEDFLNEETEFKNDMIKRIKFCCNLLMNYAVALKPIRNENLPFNDYPYGM